MSNGSGTTDQDYIRQAVELADGWEFDSNHAIDWIDVRDARGDIKFTTAIGDDIQETLDALAAQLVRQVDALESLSFPVADTWVDTEHKQTGVYRERFGELSPERLGIASGDDRTMNTIKAIVDSGVLATEQGESDGD